VASNDGDSLIGGVGALDLRDEAGSTDDVEGGDTEQALGVVDTLGLEDLRDNGDGGVDLYSISIVFSPHKYRLVATYRVGNDKDVGIRSGLSSGLGEVADNGGVGVEKV
jgi:hypothetical protein